MEFKVDENLPVEVAERLLVYAGRRMVLALLSITSHIFFLIQGMA